MKKKKKFYLLLQNGETLTKEASESVRVNRLTGKENVLAIMPVAEDEDIDDSVDKMMSSSGEFLDGIYTFKIIDLVRGTLQRLRRLAAMHEDRCHVPTLQRQLLSRHL